MYFLQTPQKYHNGDHMRKTLISLRQVVIDIVIENTRFHQRTCGVVVMARALASDGAGFKTRTAQEIQQYF